MIGKKKAQTTPNARFFALILFVLMALVALIIIFNMSGNKILGPGFG